MRGREEAERLLGDALELARNGVDEAEAALLGGELGLTRFAENEVVPAGDVALERIAVRVVVDGHLGQSEGMDLSAQGLRAAAQRARNTAELGARRARGLGHAPTPAGGETRRSFLPPGQHYRRIEHHDVETERAGALDRMALVGRVLLEAVRRDLRASGHLATGAGSLTPDGDTGAPYALANTRGLFAYAAPTRASLSLTLRRADGHTARAETEAHALSALDAEGVLTRALERVQFQGPREPVEPGPTRVLLEPAAVAALLRILADQVGARAAAEGRSFLAGRLGTAIASPRVDLLDDAGHPLHRGNPFDVDGVARRRVALIGDGMALGQVVRWSTARALGLQATGHGERDPSVERAGHLVLTVKGAVDRETLLAGAGRCLVLPRLGGLVLLDPLRLAISGRTEDGLFWAEGGRLVADAPAQRFHVDLLEVLGQVEGATAAEHAGGLVVPSLLVSGFRLDGPVPDVRLVDAGD